MMCATIFGEGFFYNIDGIHEILSLPSKFWTLHFTSGLDPRPPSTRADTALNVIDTITIMAHISRVQNICLLRVFNVSPDVANQRCHVSRPMSNAALNAGKKLLMKFALPNQPTSANGIQRMNGKWRSYSYIRFYHLCGYMLPVVRLPIVCGFETPNSVGHASLCLPYFVLLGQHNLGHI